MNTENKIRLFMILNSAIVILALSATAAAAQQASGERMIEVVLDASGSMAGKIASGEIKIEAAKKAVSELAAALPGDTILAFRAYGHQSVKEKHDCRDTELLIPFGAVSEIKDRLIDSSRKLRPRGYTPITYVIGKAAEDFPADFAGEKMIVLISDGKETCEGDPCAAAKALAKTQAKLVIHTVGFGVDEATKAQLDCIARATGGQYFGAADTAGLADVLGRAVRTATVRTVEEKGDGWIRVKGADISGHIITDAETGKEAGRAGHTQDTAKVQAGIYNVSVGKAVWKSVEVKAGETTVLEPGLLTVKSAALAGHNVVDAETGEVHGSVGSLNSTVALIPGRYEVMFGTLPWPVEIKAGRMTTLEPGTVQVKGAHYQGHKIFDATGTVIGEVSNIQNWIPLPPGDYAVEIGGKKVPFALKEGEDLVFERKD